MNRYARRRFADRAFWLAAFAAVGIALVPLFSIVYHVASRGLRGLDLAFFTETPKPVGESGGGMGNAILGSLELVALASALAVPVGVLAGVYVAEHGQERLARAVRFSADVLSGVPSITVGIFVYGVVVLSMGRFSALAGATALAIIMLPTIARVTEELVKLVPAALREAGLGLGLRRWRVTVRVVLRTALPGIVTGIMLAVARVAGETAPLLFTAFGDRGWPRAVDEPIASLPVQIYTYAVSPYEEWHDQAWTAALVLLAMVLFLNVTARLLAGHEVNST